ncbi:MAG: hypothetical protein FWD61_17375 [Phycisphaerales bacterium]|nr:hypothetical protein [Phycisphaerales bacterium]
MGCKEHGNRVLQVIRGMMESSDLQKVMDDAAITPVQAMRLLRSGQGRKQLKARQQLAKIHSELLAHRFGPFAVQKLTQLLADEKPELRLKVALALLKIGSLDKPRPSDKANYKTKENEILEDTDELREIMSAVAEVLEQRAKARLKTVE